MIKQIKKMKNMETSQEVLNRVSFITKIKEAEVYKEVIGLDNNYESFEKLETIGFKIAIKKAVTVEEIEKCATEVEEKHRGKYDPNEWADQIRIKAYGLAWYLKKQISSSCFQEFITFLQEEGVIYAKR